MRIFNFTSVIHSTKGAVDFLPDCWTVKLSGKTGVKWVWTRDPNSLFKNEWHHSGSDVFFLQLSTKVTRISRISFIICNETDTFFMGIRFTENSAGQHSTQYSNKTGTKLETNSFNQSALVAEVSNSDAVFNEKFETGWTSKTQDELVGVFRIVLELTLWSWLPFIFTLLLSDEEECWVFNLLHWSSEPMHTTCNRWSPSTGSF